MRLGMASSFLVIFNETLKLNAVTDSNFFDKIKDALLL